LPFSRDSSRPARPGVRARVVDAYGWRSDRPARVPSRTQVGEPAALAQSRAVLPFRHAAPYHHQGPPTGDSSAHVDPLGPIVVRALNLCPPFAAALPTSPQPPRAGSRVRERFVARPHPGYGHVYGLGILERALRNGHWPSPGWTSLCRPPARPAVAQRGRGPRRREVRDAARRGGRGTRANLLCAHRGPHPPAAGRRTLHSQAGRAGVAVVGVRQCGPFASPAVTPRPIQASTVRRGSSSEATFSVTCNRQRSVVPRSCLSCRLTSNQFEVVQGLRRRGRPLQYGVFFGGGGASMLLGGGAEISLMRLYVVSAIDSPSQGPASGLPAAAGSVPWCHTSSVA